MIGQFSGPYSTVRLAKMPKKERKKERKKAVFVAKMFRDLSPSVLNFFSK